MSAEQVGQRVFSVEVRCESDKGSPSDATPTAAADVLSQVMTRLYRPSIPLGPRTAGAAVVQVGNIARTEHKVEGREYDAAIVEVTFHRATSTRDGDDYWIETVNGTLTLTSDTSDRDVPPSWRSDLDTIVDVTISADGSPFSRVGFGTMALVTSQETPRRPP